MRRILRTALVGACVLAPGLPGAGGLVAQSPLTLEVRGGRAVPIQAFRKLPDSDDRLSGEHAFGLRFDLEQGAHLSLMVGFSQYRVTCAGETCGQDEQWVSTQWEIGSRWRRRSGAVRPWVSGAIVIPKVERDVADRVEISRTALGVEAGVGLLVRVTDRWYLSPGARWGRFQATFPTRGEVPIRFVTAEMGLLIAF